MIEYGDFNSICRKKCRDKTIINTLEIAWYIFQVIPGRESVGLLTNKLAVNFDLIQPSVNLNWLGLSHIRNIGWSYHLNYTILSGPWLHSKWRRPLYETFFNRVFTFENNEGISVQHVLQQTRRFCCIVSSSNQSPFNRSLNIENRQKAHEAGLDKEVHQLGSTQ